MSMPCMGRDSAAGKVKLKKFLEEIDAGMTELFMVRMVLEILVPRLQSLDRVANILKREADNSRASGVALEHAVGKRFGSITALIGNVRRSASKDARLQHKKHRIDDNEKKVERERRALKIGRNAKNKTLQSKYSTKVHRSVTQDVRADSRCDTKV
ncbi:hypothetical protein F441_07799 [Phytophthora nicotianae CJ01A1]|uniref:Uncharacterized protein n=4 Tax=Phytophthora nicotianae TaxID=4792 RepID=W2PC27_PHYN3|nr:hypothetical protein PPTG_19946 [Phytophthora nicotianae INRA-310]ETI48103.1 hypothetical protein F443_07809 [Phytophthora nicotianae P1569]ETM97763.1 hypothetical protein PPTG_19946 [Phytophthora nicotianae INRA-310]ETO76799.1 hypothetical protein F444_07876 [Phytophthora nicotianae P1976]ETP17892.1 hypothetical protein F441_07799 [Phytophthora nicotianae CJ01A1]